MQYAVTASNFKNVRFTYPTRETTRAPVKAGEEDTVRISTECGFQVPGASLMGEFPGYKREE